MLPAMSSAKTRKLVHRATAIVTAATRRAEALIAEILVKKTLIADAFYDLGLALRELQTKKMYSALGFSSFEALLCGRKLFGDTQARKLIAVVSTLDRETAIDLGVEKA